MEENNLSKRSRAAYAGLSCVLFAAVMLSGCGKARIGGSTGSADSEKTAASSEQTKVVRVIIESETEAETTPETQKLITSVDYTSKDGTVKITLPDNTWKVTQDADEMRVFSSGNDAMINIVHASTEAAMKTLTVQTTKENLQAALLSQYSEASAFNIESYETKTVGSVNVYRYVVRYNADARMWAYAVTYGIVAPDQAYVITGTITDNNTTLLKAVEDSVYSFSVLKDEELKAVTDAMTGESETASTETKQTTAQTASPTASGENSTLSTYAQQTTMYSADSDVVNIRSGPGTDADIVGTLAAGGKVTVTGETSGWYQVSVNGVTGYIRKDFLTSTQTTTPSTTSAANSTSDSASAAEIASASNYSSASTLYTTDGVNVRANPGTGSGVLATLGAGSAVTVIGETDNWYIVSTGSGKGYISKSYLSSKAPTGSGASGSSSTGSAGSTGNGNGTSSGSTGSSGGGSGSGTQTSGVSTITGTVTSSSANSVTVAGDDGKTYTIYTGDADITTADGLYSGLHISASVDNSQTASDGTKYATSVTGE